MSAKHAFSLWTWQVGSLPHGERLTSARRISASPLGQPAAQDGLQTRRRGKEMRPLRMGRQAVNRRDIHAEEPRAGQAAKPAVVSASFLAAQRCRRRLFAMATTAHALGVNGLLAAGMLFGGRARGTR